MTCAYYLANLGHEVHVYEAESVAGGVLYWGIPEYRLPKEVLAKEVKAIEQRGVNIHCNVRIGEAVSFEELKNQSDAVYVAIGTQQSRTLGIPGEDLPGVENGLIFLKRIGLKQSLSVPERLVVIGGGSTAMDVARTAVRLGSKEVTVVYRRTEREMPAGAEAPGKPAGPCFPRIGGKTGPGWRLVPTMFPKAGRARLSVGSGGKGA